ncbi:AAA family ATPase [Microbacterium sp. NPDC077391]|uniref:AAA family ATPase n=1 Tax=Microbacterium commune TaxID=2762219 RepID=A0ABR8W743_9MICO|nr:MULTISPECIES: AAA family ATPase [Microbacterium]MBD8012835.1 AAA family ATPase [Microbacterium commune]
MADAHNDSGAGPLRRRTSAARRSAPEPESMVSEVPLVASDGPVEAPRYHRGSAAASAPAPAPESAPAAPALPTTPPASPVSRREQRERPSFLQQERREEPARTGARGMLNRIGFSLAPGAAERAVREDELLVSQHWPGPRTIAVVNGKGGAGKTPTTVLLSAVFARFGGAGVLAWDNNQTRGTLGWRTDTGPHDRTLFELLPEADRLLGAGAQSADLAHFVHHQAREKYDVLRSKPMRLAQENRLRSADIDAIHAVAAKYYRLIIIDSGNDESDPMWLRMIDHADQIVVATTTRDDHAEAGALLLEALEDRDERSARLARQSVVVVTQADPKATPADVDQVVTGYRDLAREVVAIPFDHEMVDGHLRLGALAPASQTAWLAAGAAVARGL